MFSREAVRELFGKVGIISEGSSNSHLTMSLMKKRSFLQIVAALTAFTGLAVTSRASVNLAPPNVITPGDTFTFAIAGFNSTSGTGYILGSGEIATFGATQTYVAAGYNGQNYTITSSEAIGATTTVDTITVSTPTSFLTSTTVNGTTINALQFDVGDSNSGVGVATGANPLNYLTPVTGATSTGYIIYGTANTQFNLTSAPTLPTTMSLTDVEGVNTGTTAISGIAIHQFTLTISYPTLAAAPEPSTWAMCGLGLVGGAVMIRRRRTA